MSLFGTILAADSAPDWMAPDSDFWYGGGIGSHGKSAAGRYVSPEIAMRVSTVYACVNLLSKTVASLPLQIYRMDPNGKVIIAPDHPLNDVIEHQPNNWQTAWDFWAMMMMHLALRGNAYAEIVPGRRGAVDQLIPLHPDNVIVQRLVDNSLLYTVVENSGEVRKLVQDEVFHIRSAICPDGFRGLSPIAYARETVGLTLAAEEHGARMFSNGARPSGIVQLKGRLRQGAFDRFKSEFNSAYGNGVGNSNKTLILEDGAEFKPITMTADEIQFLGLREFEIEEIARWFDVPLVLLHHNTKNTSWGTGVEAIMLAFVRNNLMPWLRSITQAIRRDLITAPMAFKAEFDVSALQRGDSRALADFLTRLVLGGILTRNEARAVLQYNSIEGLDEPLQPVNMTPAGTDPTPQDNQGTTVQP